MLCWPGMVLNMLKLKCVLKRCAEAVPLQLGPSDCPQCEDGRLGPVLLYHSWLHSCGRELLLLGGASAAAGGDFCSGLSGAEPTAEAVLKESVQQAVGQLHLLHFVPSDAHPNGAV